MKRCSWLFGIALLSCTCGVSETQTHYFSIKLNLVQTAGVDKTQISPVVRITLTNISSQALMVGEAGAFFDYLITLLGSSGRPVPMTKEGDATRPGGGRAGVFVIQSAKEAPLQPGQSSSEDLDLRKYFDIKTPGTYKLQVTRKFQHPADNVSSDILLVTTK